LLAVSFEKITLNFKKGTLKANWIYKMRKPKKLFYTTYNDGIYFLPVLVSEKG